VRANTRRLSHAIGPALEQEDEADVPCSLFALASLMRSYAQASNSAACPGRSLQTVNAHPESTFRDTANDATRITLRTSKARTPMLFIVLGLWYDKIAGKDMNAVGDT
jgi:hypothetical protein